MNRTGFLERENALDHYFQTLLLNGLKECEPREQKSSGMEPTEADLKDLGD